MAAADVQLLLDRCDRSTDVGVRDFAIMMLVPHLGLRSIEVAAGTPRPTGCSRAWWPTSTARGLPTVTIEAALGWAQLAPKSPAGRVTTIGPRRMTAARGFARYLSGIDASTQVPPLGLMPRRGPWRQPFIYTSADIGALLAAARRRIASPLRAATYQTLIGLLLAASGMRIGEASSSTAGTSTGLRAYC